jgi:hypothetical protein
LGYPKLPHDLMDIVGVGNFDPLTRLSLK